MVNNIFTSIFGKDSSQTLTWKFVVIHRAMVVTSALCSILIAMWLSNLAVILKYAGIFGFFVSICTPPILQIYSQMKCDKLFDDHNNTVQQTKAYTFTSTGSTLSKSKALEEGLETNTNSTDETKPLLGHGRSGRQMSIRMNPYSTMFSYLPCVVTIGIVAVCLMLTTICSAFVHPS